MKSKKIFPLLWISLFFLFRVTCIAQDTSGQQPPESKPEASLSILFSKTEITLRNGRSFYGLLLGLEGEKLVLRTGKEEKKFAYADLARASVELEKKANKSILPLSLLGIYSGSLVLFKAKNQPLAYAQQGLDLSLLGYIFWASAFGGGGGALGYLAGMLEKDKITFSFNGSPEQRLREWDRFRKFILIGKEKRRSKKIHATLQAAQVDADVSRTYKALFQKSGLSPTYWSYEIENAYPATNFNLLRKAQVAYSVKPGLEAGAAVFFLGEPSIGGYTYRYSYWDSYMLELRQSLSVTGYYAVGSYRLLSGLLPDRIAWKIGLGLGAANSDFKLKAFMEKHEGGRYVTENSEQRIKKTHPSGVVFTELSLIVQENFSLGLGADYVFLPSEDVPALPEWEIPAQRIKLSSASLGGSLGFHF